MRLWPFVCRCGFFKLSVGSINKIMPLWFSFDVVAFVQSGIKPLWTVWNAGLVEDAVYQLFVEHSSVGWRAEVSISFTPYFPAIGQAMCNLFNRSFTTC